MPNIDDVLYESRALLSNDSEALRVGDQVFDLIRALVGECERSQSENRTKAKFTDDFITIFLATWTANHYDDFCQRGWANHYPKELPTEDAGQLADDAWEALMKEHETR